MKLKNKTTGVIAEVGDVLAGVLVAAGGWEKAEEAVQAPEPVKAVRRRAPAKKAAPAETAEG